MYLRLLKSLTLFAFDYIKQWYWVRTILKPFLVEFFKVPDGSLEKADLIKITRIYAYVVALLIAQPVQRLRSIRFCSDQSRIFGFAGVLTGMIDDYFDKFRLDSTIIHQMVNNPYVYIPENQHQMLSNFLLKQMDFSLCKFNLDQILFWQMESQKQYSAAISTIELENIIINKSGYSGFLYADLIQPDLTEAERRMLWNLCVMVQTANDIFDIYKDTKEGIYTTVNKMKTPQEISEHFHGHIIRWLESVKSLPYPPEKKRNFIERIALLVISRTYVCLDQYQDLYAVSGRFDIKNFSRKQMICDMERPVNILRWFRHFFKFDL